VQVPIRGFWLSPKVAIPARVALLQQGLRLEDCNGGSRCDWIFQSTIILLFDDLSPIQMLLHINSSKLVLFC